MLFLDGSGEVVVAEDSSIEAYRAMLRRFEKNVTTWRNTAREARVYMTKNDPDLPKFHLTAPEGWINDPNGVVFDAKRKVYHRFYQYDKTWCSQCMHGNVLDCRNFSFDGSNLNARTWGHAISTNLVHWSDWPGIDSDSPYDAVAVFSGNCVVRDSGDPVCIYSGGTIAPCDTGVCATSNDWVHWKKSACMTHAPSKASQTNHDSSLVRLHNGTYILLSGGCTYGVDGSNVPPSPNATCRGNAQVWTSEDLLTWQYRKALTDGTMTSAKYWELPYLLPFDSDGNALRNDQISDADVTALLFGDGNAFTVGDFDDGDILFVPRNGTPVRQLDSRAAYYSFNPSATDMNKSNFTRRIMFGWILGPESVAVTTGKVPFWQSAHSIPRTLTVVNPTSAGATIDIAQSPVHEMSLLRNRSILSVNDMMGEDSVEIIATWSVSKHTQFVGFKLRQLVDLNFSCDVVYDVVNQTLSVGSSTDREWWPTRVLPQPPGRVRLHIFLDRSVVEVFTGGAALTGRCMLPKGALGSCALPFSAEEFPSDATLIGFDAWTMDGAWGF